MSAQDLDGIPESARPHVADARVSEREGDALTTDRPYRKGFSHADALSIMMGDRERSLDPALMNLFAEQVAPVLQRPPVKAAGSPAGRRGRSTTPSTGVATAH